MTRMTRARPYACVITKSIGSMLTKQGFGSPKQHPYILIQISYQSIMLPFWLSTVASIGMAVGPPLVCTGQHTSGHCGD